MEPELNTDAALRHKVVKAYLLIFSLLALWKWLEGGWLYQYQPFVFQTRTDGTTWLFMRTGFHQWLISHPNMYLWADIFFYSMPFVWFWIDLRRPEKSWIAGCLMLVVNWIYVQVFTLYPTNSIEGHLAWLLMPLLFIMRGQKGFWLMLGGLRYVFLFFFFSAGVWKLYWGGVFVPRQLSFALTGQHAHFLTLSPNAAFTKFILWLIDHPQIGWLLYASATLTELFFVVGFFSKRWDRWLVVMFLLFLVLDHLIMRIAYYEMIPMVIPLYFASREPLMQTD